MQQITDVSVIGGTGKAGTFLVQQLIHQGFHLNLLHRPGTRVVEHPSITPIVGDARDYSAIRSLADKVSATSLAHFLVEQLTSDQHVRQAPFVANARASDSPSGATD